DPSGEQRPDRTHHAAVGLAGGPGLVDGRVDHVRERPGACEPGGAPARQRPSAAIRARDRGVHRAGLVLPASKRPAWQIERKIEKRLPDAVFDVARTNRPGAASLVSRGSKMLAFLVSWALVFGFVQAAPPKPEPVPPPKPEQTAPAKPEQTAAPKPDPAAAPASDAAAAPKPKQGPPP